MDEDEVRSSKFEIRGHRGASRSRGGTRARRPHHVCPSGVHQPRLVGVGIRTTAFLPPRHTAKTATRVRSSAESIETSPRSMQNTGRPTGETRACDVATAGVTAGKSGDYATVDVSRVTNRKLVAGNGQTAPGRIHDLVGIGSEAEQHCPPAQQGDPLLDAINPRAECFPSQKHMDHRSRSLRRVGEEGLSERIRKMFQLSHTPFGALSRDALW